MPWLGSHTLVLRDQAIEVVGSVLERFGELLPLRCEGARLVLFSTSSSEGVLDEGNSDVVRFGSGRIMALRNPVFRVDLLGDRAAFKVAEMRRGDLYLTESLVHAIQATKMAAGTDFTLVYDAGGGS